MPSKYSVLVLSKPILMIVRELRTVPKRFPTKIQNEEVIIKNLPQAQDNINIQSRHNADDQVILPLSEIDLDNLHKKDHLFYSIKSLSEPESIIEENEENSGPKKIKSVPIKNLKELVLQLPIMEAPTVENQFEKLNEVVEPLSKYAYTKQMYIKEKYINKYVMPNLRNGFKHFNTPLLNKYFKSPCPVQPIISPENILEYRNKDTFSVNQGADGNMKTVGHYYGPPKDPNMRCIPPTNLIIVKESHKRVAKHFQDFIRASPLPPCINFSEGGVWRSLMVRSNLKGDLMATVHIYSGDITEEQKQDIKRDLTDFFFRGPGAECNLTSLYFQAGLKTKDTRDEAPYELLKGARHLQETCLGKKFLISPDSFFQVNTSGAELLYQSIRQVSELTTRSTLLDLCCGTGPIGILLSPHCRSVIGIDVVPESIENAERNAAANGVRNAQFICGDVTQVLPTLIKELEESSDVVAVLNPARAGVGFSVIKTIRQCRSIKKIIYVTCKPEGQVLRNMVDLCKVRKTSAFYSKEDQKKNPPFNLSYVIPIDMFPHTLHIEYVFLFHRLQK